MANEITEADHSMVGPSSAHQWMNCAGRNNFLKAHKLGEEESSEPAARGTVQHEVSAECLTTGKDSWEFFGDIRKHESFSFEMDEDLIGDVESVLGFTRSKFQEYAHLGAIMYSETRVRSELDSQAYGTCDIRMEVPADRLIIIDFKFGFVKVDPDDEQVKLYGYYAYEMRSAMMRGKGEPKVIELWIAQPNLPNPAHHFRKYETTPKELEDFFVKTALPAMKATRDPNAPLTSGPWCKFCPANTSSKCPAVHKEIVSAPVNQPPDTLTNEEIGRLKTMKPVFDRFFLGLDLEALIRIRDRKETIPGWKMVHKLGDRVWKTDFTETIDGNEVTIRTEDALIAKYGEKAKTAPKLKSPAQIEKLSGGKALAARLAYKPDTGMTLASEADAREPAVGLMARAVAGNVLVDDTGPTTEEL